MSYGFLYLHSFILTAVAILKEDISYIFYIWILYWYDRLVHNVSDKNIPVARTCRVSTNVNK